MQQDKVKITLGGISASMLSCLLGRAQLSKEYSSLFYDEKAIELIERIDYDVPTNDIPWDGINFNIYRKLSRKLNLPEFGVGTLRAKQFDEKAKAYIAVHPNASIINIAAGLDTTFYRVDNGLIHWYDLDLPPAIEVREQLLPKPDRVTYIAKSLLDSSWCDDIEHTKEGVFIMAGGVLPFFEESEIKQFFSMLADNFPGGEIVFDAPLTLDDNVGSWIDTYSQEQRDAMRSVWSEALKDWWEKAPQDQRDEVSVVGPTQR